MVYPSLFITLHNMGNNKHTQLVDFSNPNADKITSASTQTPMSLDLNKLTNNLDEALSNETTETLTKFLKDKKMKNNKQKPPLGLMPHSVFLLRRLEEIFQAIERYYEASMQIPIEWITEYNILIEMYKNNLGSNEQQ